MPYTRRHSDSAGKRYHKPLKRGFASLPWDIVVRLLCGFQGISQNQPRQVDGIYIVLDGLDECADMTQRCNDRPPKSFVDCLRSNPNARWQHRRTFHSEEPRIPPLHVEASKYHRMISPSLHYSGLMVMKTRDSVVREPRNATTCSWPVALIG